MTNRTFGKECWRSSLSKLCHPSSKGGRFKWRSGNHYSTKYIQGNGRFHEQTEEDSLIIDGYPWLDKDHGSIAVIATGTNSRKFKAAEKQKGDSARK